MEGFVEVSAILRTGVYALVKDGTVVYVGKAKAMLQRVYAHKNLYASRSKKPDWMPIKGILFDEVWVRPCRQDLVDELEREMINLYKPRYNKLLKTPGKTLAEIPLVVGGVSLRLNAEPERMVRRC